MAKTELMDRQLEFDRKHDIIMSLNVMIRTTVMLPEEIKGRAEEEARREGISFGEFVRQALEGELTKRTSGQSPSRRSRDPLFLRFEKLASVAKPSDADGALNHDKYLYGR